jgi:hypothetical protein
MDLNNPELKSRYRKAVEVMSFIFLIYFWGGGNFDAAISAPYIAVTLDPLRGKIIVSTFAWIFFLWSYKCYRNNIPGVFKIAQIEFVDLVKVNTFQNELKKIIAKTHKDVSLASIIDIRRLDAISPLHWSINTRIRNPKNGVSSFDFKVNPIFFPILMFRLYKTVVFYRNGFAEDTLPCLLWYLALTSAVVSISINSFLQIFPMIRLFGLY